MKRNVSSFWPWVIGSCLSFGSAMCMVTAFSLPADLTAVGIFCLIFCALTVFACRFRWGGIVMGSLVIAVIGYALQEGTLLLQLQRLILQLMSIYTKAYGWQVPDFGIINTLPRDVTLAVMLLALVAGLGATLSLYCRKGTLFGMLAGMLPLFTCVVVTDTPPAAWCVFLVMASLLLWVLTQNLCRRDPRSGARLAALLLIPVLLCSWLLMEQTGPESYQLHQAYLETWLPFFAETPGGNSIGGGNTRASLDLAILGPKSLSRRKVMEVTAAFDGTLYLRGQAFDIYDGQSWSITPGGENPSLWPQLLKRKGQVNISLEVERDLLYTPYYRHGSWANQLHNGRLPNTGNETEYWFYMYTPLPATVGTFQLTPEDQLRYLGLPQQTLEAARQILKDNGLEKADAKQIVDFVSKSAKYSLGTSRMDLDSEDFAIWFLTEADTGYCIHFATAAVVLLRAAGIPARYVDGYVVNTQKDVPVEIIESAAHAWVEYVDSTYGWSVLEATPAYVQAPSTQPTEPEPSQTDPTETEPSESTEPSEETTLPSDSQNTQPGGNDTTRPSTGPTAPSTGPSGGGAGGTDLRQLLPILQWLAGIAGTVVLLWGQYRLRRYLRLRSLEKGNANARALACWREVCRNCRILKEKPADTLRELAEKAKFSRHALTSQELSRFTAQLHSQNRALQQRKWYQRLLTKLLWATP